MNKTGTIIGAGVLGVVGVLGRAGDDIARVLTKGANSADEFVPAMTTHADDLYTPGAVRYSDDAGGWTTADGGRVVIDHLPTGIEAIIESQNAPEHHRPTYDPMRGINRPTFTPPSALPRHQPSIHDRFTAPPVPQPYTPPTPHGQ